MFIIQQYLTHISHLSAKANASKLFWNLNKNEINGRLYNEFTF
jgi:hypothetical protein